jgi:hypothetical protein
MNSNLAKLTSTVIIIALIADFLFLPPLLIKLEGIKPSVTQKNKNITAEPVPVKVKS